MLIFGIVLAVIGLLLAGSGPRADRRFRTGYKNNEIPNRRLQAVGVLVALSGGLIAWAALPDNSDSKDGTSEPPRMGLSEAEDLAPRTASGRAAPAGSTRPHGTDGADEKTRKDGKGAADRKDPTDRPAAPTRDGRERTETVPARVSARTDGTPGGAPTAGDDAAVAAALEALRPLAMKCAAVGGGLVRVKVRVGMAGSLEYVHVEPPGAGTPQADCVAAVLRSAKLPNPSAALVLPFVVDLATRSRTDLKDPFAE